MAQAPLHVGMIAGGGSLPGELADSIVSRGGRVFIVLVDGAADPALKAYPHVTVNWAQLGRATAALTRAGVRDVLLLGTYKRPSFRDARPDFGFIAALPPILRLLKAGGDDAVLRGLLQLFERRGFRIVGVDAVAPELLIGSGSLTERQPSARENEDIALGFALIAALGRHDIGQAAVIHDGQVVAIEGAEGTDRMLQRVIAARRGGDTETGGGVLVKRPKPGQDLRVDLPAIGPSTVRHAREARLAGLAVMAGHVLAADKPALLAEADRSALFVMGVDSDRARHDAPTLHTANADVATIGSVALSADLKGDALRGAAIFETLSDFATGSALVINGKRVFAIGAGEPPREVILRTVRSDERHRARRGVALIGPGHVLDAGVLEAAAQAHLAGVVSVDDGEMSPQLLSLASRADQLGLSLCRMSLARRRDAE